MPPTRSLRNRNETVAFQTGHPVFQHVCLGASATGEEGGVSQADRHVRSLGDGGMDFRSVERATKT
jgi:hypothetical protein